MSIKSMHIRKTAEDTDCSLLSEDCLEFPRKCCACIKIPLAGSGKFIKKCICAQTISGLITSEFTSSVVDGSPQTPQIWHKVDGRLGAVRAHCD